MSTVVGSIIANLQLNIDNFSRNMQEAQNQMQDTQSKMDKFGKLGETFTATGKKLTLGVTTPIVGLGTAIVKTTSDFDSSMSNVQAISGATGDEFTKLRQKAQEMGATTQFSASEAADAMGYMAMAGWDSTKIMNGLGGVMDLAAASGEDLATVSDIVTDAMTAFGLEADKSGEFADVLAAASSNANTNVSLLGESFKYVAPLAGSLGYTSQDTAVALGLMANAGIKGSQGGTALRAALTRMIKPTKDAAAIMDEYGLSMTNSDGSMKSLNEVMEMLRLKLGDVDEATQAQAASALFGQEAMSGMLAVINASPTDFDKLTGAINGADGAASDMAATMNDNLEGKIKTLKSAIEGVAIQLGDILIPIITNVVEWINKWVTRFGSLDEGTQKVVLVIAGLVAAVGPALLVMGNMITAVNNIRKAYQATKAAIIAFKSAQIITTTVTKLATAAQTALNVAMSLNPIGLVIAAIVALVAVFVVLWKKCDWFREFWINLWEGLKVAASALWEWLKDACKVCIDFLVFLIKGYVVFWVSVWKLLMAAPKALWNWLKNLFGDVWEGLKAGWIAFKDGFQNMWQGIKDWFSGLWDSITGIFSNALGWVTETFSGTFQAITGIWDGIKQYFAGAWEVIKNIFMGALLLIIDLITLDFGKMKEDIIAIWTNIKEGLGQMWEGITTAFTSWIEAIKTFWLEYWTAIKSAVISIWENIKEFFVNMWEGIKTGFVTWLEGVKEFWTNLWNTMKNTVTNVWNAIKNFFVDMWTNIGNKITESWTNFKSIIVNKVTEIKTWIVNTWNTILNWFRELPGKLRTIGSTMFSKMREGISSTISGIFGAVKSGMNSAITFLTNLPKQALTWGKHMIEGFIQGVKNTVGKLIDCVKGVGQSIRDFLGFTVPKKGPLHVYMEWMPHMMEGMRDSLQDNEHKLINAAKGVAGNLNDAINSDVALATDSVDINANGTITSRTVQPVVDKETSMIQQLISEIKKLSEKSPEYNINIDHVDVDNPNDVRKLAEDLEFFKNKDFRY